MENYACRSEWSTQARHDLVAAYRQAAEFSTMTKTVAQSGSHSRQAVSMLAWSHMFVLVASWQQFCVDLAQEVVGACINHADADAVPDRVKTLASKQLRLSIERQLDTDPTNEPLDAWAWVDDGWTNWIQTNIEDIGRKLATPSSKKVDGFFHSALGISHISQSWNFDDYRSDESTELLDNTLKQRHLVAHTSVATTHQIPKSRATKFGHLLLGLSLRTEETVIRDFSGQLTPLSVSPHRVTDGAMRKIVSTGLLFELPESRLDAGQSNSM